MCGIAGGPTFDKAFSLYEANLKRGSFCSGVLAFDSEHGVYVRRQKEILNKEALFWDITKQIKDPLYYLFHSRAPTNSTKPFVETDCHPFEFGNYYVAHNGIITNFKSFPESAEFDVDSSIMPFHITKNNNSVKEAYEKYEGLLTSWIYDYVNMNLMVVKAGSSLHMDEDSFSSVAFEGSHSVDEDGVVYFLHQKKFAQAKGLTFKYDNPYEL